MFLFINSKMNYVGMTMFSFVYSKINDTGMTN